MYTKVPTDLNFIEREKATLQNWNENNIFEKSMAIRSGCPTYTFYDGPPTANGKPHFGHILTRVIKDTIPRYRTMKGYFVPRKAGWDTHGLPVELEVEKELNLDGKEQIEAFGLDPFIGKCKESVWRYKEMWEDFSGTVGFWADMDAPYVTYHDNYIESVWWALKQIWDKDLLYKGFKIVPYCPRCGTPLSSHEVAQGYQDLKERSAIVRFKLKDEDAYVLAWTTTPWTLPSNLGLCINPNETYAKVKAADGYIYYLAEALVESVLGSIDKDNTRYETIATFKGKELEYKEYEPLFDFGRESVAKQGKKAWYIVCDEFVTLTDGTGVVHVAPAFGEDDQKVCLRYDMPFIQFVDTKGEMTGETDWPGIFVKNADPLIIADLEKSGKLFSAPEYEHNYPHCWRCKTPLIYYARESWYIKMTAVQEDLIRNNNTINWIPESIGKGRFGDWLENIQDWAISRNRYWGTPLNIWECVCGHFESIGSRDELYKLSKNPLAQTVELHRPYIDEITGNCAKCGQTMHRVPEVIDCWFDSGAMPFAQHHYPFENQELFEAQFPAQFISEGIDQTRGWFYSLLAISTLLFNKSSYENCIVLGHVSDEKGQKMSKSKGNVVDPFDALLEFGADAIRWYFCVNSAPWLPNRYHGRAVVEGQRRFMGTLWNTYAFFVLYANIDNFDATKFELDLNTLTVMDKWLLSKLNTLIKTVDDNLENYRITETARALEKFVDEMSNWYVRRSRERFWAKGMEQDKINAYMTLYTTLVALCKCAAPMIPFMTDDIYRNLVLSLDKSAPESIHLCDFPAADLSMIDKDLEKSMDMVLDVVVKGRACRNKANLKNRQPLETLYVPTNLFENEDKVGVHLGANYYEAIIKDELNVKNIEQIEKHELDEYVSYTFKPQLRTVGPKYGKHLGGIQKTLANLDGNKAMAELKTGGFIKFMVNDEEINLTEEDLLIEMTQKEGYVSEGDNKITVVIKTELTDELIEEGFVYELISKIQTMRKEAGFEVTDRIRVQITENTYIMEIASRNHIAIAEKVLADTIDSNPLSPGAFGREWNINGEMVKMAVERV
ncbi:MAG: isoleucine--tRNA ligase [Lachnospiraceae bacterium]|nr:isoleucine--tRNA ligase [Lachnospiraceae bacterium]